jgi:hypothetical protein
MEGMIFGGQPVCGARAKQLPRGALAAVDEHAGAPAGDRGRGEATVGARGCAAVPAKRTETPSIRRSGGALPLP